MILHGDSLSVLKTLPDNSVQCVVTSPPYWALRRYDIPDIVFDGDPTCDHEWTEQRAPWANSQPGPNGAIKNRVDEEQVVGKTAGAFCRCGAWRGQLGQEPTPQLFITHLVDIFREVRRVLREDGTCWINMGDCYASGSRGGYDRKRQGVSKNKGNNHADDFLAAPNRLPVRGLKNKDLVGIPWMMAFALREDGWYLRAENIWAKGVSFCSSYAGSVMPESVKDRPTRSHEQVFLLTKSPDYFYDDEAVKETGVHPAGYRAAKGSGTREGNRRGGTDKQSGHGKRHAGFNERYFTPDEDGYVTYDGKRRMRTVWVIGVEPFDEAHFATFPPDLVYPCLKAGTSAKGACTACGAPWERIVEYEPLPDLVKEQFEAARQSTADNHGRDDGFTTTKPNYVRKKLGEKWEPTCACQHVEGGPQKTGRCVVLDPFAGSGTVGVATEHMQSLSFIGIEPGAGYVEMAERRVGGVAPLFAVEPTT